MKRIGVVGAGVMGAGIAQALAQTRHDVVLVDRSSTALDRVPDAVRSEIRLQKLTGKLAPGADGDADRVIERIVKTTEYQALDGVDFLIESITEQWSAKEKAFQQFDMVCPANCVFASNTSAISITRIASVTTRPGQVIGMHFMNPATMMPTVELIRGFHSSQESIDAANQLLAAMGKESVLVNDMPGFVSNRVLMLTINEAIFVAQDKVAETADIDKVFRDCFGHPMGPLALGDLIGLDTILYSLEVLQESYADDKYRPCPLLKTMVHAGLLGRKSGRGFFTYETA